MTWIIAVAPAVGDGIMVSDLRVTFTLPDKKEFFLDCLQKIYYVGPCVSAGFAGSVKIGFRQISMLRDELSRAQPGRAWNLGEISCTWLPGLLRRVYDLSEKEEQQHGSEIIIVAAHPSKNQGPFPLIEAFKFQVCWFSGKWTFQLLI